jgi:hypothetical protein
MQILQEFRKADVNDDATISGGKKENRNERTTYVKVIITDNELEIKGRDLMEIDS